MNLKKIYVFFGILVFILSWETLSLIKSGVFIPHFHKIFYSFINILLGKTVWISIAHTLVVIFGGIFLAVFFGLFFSMSMTLSKACAYMAEPVLNFIRHIPTIALYPVFLAVFGVSDMARIVLVALNAFPAVVLSSFYGLKVIDKSVIEAGRCEGCGEFIILLAIRLPIALGEILNGIRIAIGNGFVAIVVAEMLGATDGLGFMILWATNAFDYPSVYAYIMILALIGLFINKGVAFGIKKIEGDIYEK